MKITLNTPEAIDINNNTITFNADVSVKVCNPSDNTKNNIDTIINTALTPNIITLLYYRLTFL